MEIKTKFNIGAPVWTIKNCTPVLMKVRTVTISASGTSYGLKYTDFLSGEALFHTAPESEIFPDRQQLIDHITSSSDGNENM